MEAMELPEAAGCKVATVKGMDSLKELNVYTLIPKWTIPPVTKIIGSKRVCKRKADSTYKARIVAQGWNLVPGIDCGGVSSPVYRLQSIGMVLAIAADLNWEVLQLDVRTAFLKADIERDVYVAEAPGFETTGECPQAMKLLKSLYGLPHFAHELVEHYRLVPGRN